MRWLLDRINGWVILISLLVATGLVIVFGLLVFLTPATNAQIPVQQAGITVIPAPSATPTQPKIIETLTPTAPPAIDGISVGSYVQIAGTDGAAQVANGGGQAAVIEHIGRSDAGRSQRGAGSRAHHQHQRRHGQLGRSPLSMRQGHPPGALRRSCCNDCASRVAAPLWWTHTSAGPTNLSYST